MCKNDEFSARVQKILDDRKQLGVRAKTVAVVPWHPQRWIFLELICVLLQVSEIVKRIGAAEFGRVDQAHDREGRIVIREVDGTAETVMIPSKLFHDFRRTAARDIYMATKDVATAEAMTGHKTHAMFDRYNIVVNDQKAEALTAG